MKSKKDDNGPIRSYILRFPKLFSYGISVVFYIHTVITVPVA